MHSAWRTKFYSLSIYLKIKRIKSLSFDCICSFKAILRRRGRYKPMPETSTAEWLAILEAASQFRAEQSNTEWEWLMRELGLGPEYFLRSTKPSGKEDGAPLRILKPT